MHFIFTCFLLLHLVVICRVFENWRLWHVYCQRLYIRITFLKIAFLLRFFLLSHFILISVAIYLGLSWGLFDSRYIFCQLKNLFLEVCWLTKRVDNWRSRWIGFFCYVSYRLLSAMNLPFQQKIIKSLNWIFDLFRVFICIYLMLRAEFTLILLAVRIFKLFYKIFRMLILGLNAMFFFNLLYFLFILHVNVPYLYLELSFFLIEINQIILNKRLNVKILLMSSYCISWLRRNRRKGFFKILRCFWLWFFWVFLF